MKWTNSYRSFGLKTKRSTGLKTIEHKQAVMAVPVPFAGEHPGEGCRRQGLPVSPRTHPTDERSLTSCLCIKELIDGSNGLSWHPYAFVWRFSEGVRGNLRAGPTGIRCDALAIRRLGLLRTKTKKTARSTHGERHHGRCARPRQPITLHPRRGCAKRKPSRTISRPESRHSCTTSQTTSATGPRKRRFPNAPTRKR